jgi:hypothetical protein
MRHLLPVPDAALEPGTGEPRYGSYVGGLPRVDLVPRLTSWRTRVARHKRWMYVAIASEDLYVAVCVVRLGYAANAWAFAYDARAHRLLVDGSLLAPPFACKVGDTASEGCEARIAWGGERIAIVRRPGTGSYAVDAKMGGLELEARLSTTGAPPAVTAIARLGEGLFGTTEKRALLGVEGHARVGGERRSLGGALAGYDFTHGILARHTAWRWAFLLGRASTGERVAMNLVQGFVGEAECAAWVEGDVHPVGEGRFDFDARDPLRSWSIATDDGGVDLRFDPGGAHIERRNLGIVASRFVHPIGAFSGTFHVGGRRLVLSRALGVTEDQDVLW